MIKRLSDILKEILNESKEFIIWGIPPKKNDEEILYTKAKSKSEADKVVKILTDKYGCKKVRIQILDLSQDTDFSKEFGNTIREGKERSVIDDKSKEFKRLSLSRKDFSPAVFSKGWPADKRFALILIKRNGKVDVLSANRDIKTAQANLNMWASKYAYPKEVKSWEIIPLKPLQSVSEADSPTERTRRYNRKNKAKVRRYLKSTQDDRVARNGDRRKAEKRHGKAKIANKDIHHPNGPQNGGYKIVKKDHGPDKKD